MTDHRKPGSDPWIEPIEIPSDPTATVYPLFWETYEVVEEKPEFITVHPNRPDRFFRTSEPRIAVSPLQALIRNRRVGIDPATKDGIVLVSGDNGTTAPGTSTTPVPSSSREAAETPS